MFLKYKIFASLEKVSNLLHGCNHSVLRILSGFKPASRAIVTSLENKGRPLVIWADIGNDFVGQCFETDLYAPQIFAQHTTDFIGRDKFFIGEGQVCVDDTADMQQVEALDVKELKSFLVTFYKLIRANPQLLPGRLDERFR